MFTIATKCLVRLNTTSVYNHKYISFGYMFRFISTIFTSLFTRWRYIQFAHTLQLHSMCTYITMYIQYLHTLQCTLICAYITIAFSVHIHYSYIQSAHTLQCTLNICIHCSVHSICAYITITFSVHIHYNVCAH